MKTRKESVFGFYHVFTRGVGRQRIFEEAGDFRFFIALMFKYQGSVAIHAWCLMSNHYHLVVQCSLTDLSRFMANLNSTYAAYYNSKYEHVGHLFQGKFKSQPIESEQHFLAALRYVHRNPVESGLATTCDYPWSSYPDYLNHQGKTTTFLASSLLGGTAEFIAFHNGTSRSTFEFLDDDNNPRRSRTRAMPDAYICKLAEGVLGKRWRHDLPLWSKAIRTKAFQLLKNLGASLRQIERLTGIGRGIIMRAWAAVADSVPLQQEINQPSSTSTSSPTKEYAIKQPELTPPSSLPLWMSPFYFKEDKTASA